MILLLVLGLISINVGTMVLINDTIVANNSSELDLKLLNMTDSINVVGKLVHFLYSS